jgi:hypothetical protein
VICVWWDRERLRWNVLERGIVGWTFSVRFVGVEPRTATRARDPLPEGGAVLPHAWVQAEGRLRVEDGGGLVVEVDHGP